MSGPKRGSWSVAPVLPPPSRMDRRLDDLGQFASKQEDWLQRHGALLRDSLGEGALAQARAALDAVLDCIDAREPDAGFDLYGATWSLFNDLYRQARAARQAREAQQFRQRRQAADLLAACKAAWDAAENQALLNRWVDASERKRLAQSLRSALAAPPEQAAARASAFRDNLARVLGGAAEKAEENTRAVSRQVSQLRAALQALGGLNTGLLAEAEQAAFDGARTRLQQQADAAVAAEDPGAIQCAVQKLGELARECEPRIKAAELRKAGEAWRLALANCGYAVSTREGADGSLVFEASSFPMKSLSVEVRLGANEVRLNVGGDHARCVKDVQALQAELGRQGLELQMTDWGGGNPGTVAQQTANRLSVGGAR